MRNTILIFALALVGVLGFGVLQSHAGTPPKDPVAAHGEYLVTIGGCNDCHTPKIFTDHGPEPDMTRALSGHPGDQKLPALPEGVLGPDKWGTVGTNDLTAWYGPWGVSFTKNLTPDVETGLGSWTEDMFKNALRTGKHMGAPDGRNILPPMPWPMYKNFTDADIHAVWTYLRTLKPIKNAVPEPIPPKAAPAK